MGAFKLLHGRASGGGTTNVTFTLPTTGKTLLATGSALTALNSMPNGATVTLTQSGAGAPVELGYGTLYTESPQVVPAPVAAYTGVEGTGYTSWTEDGNARTLTPDNSTAQGNGTAALGNETRGSTAKAMLQCATVPHQRFTSKLTLMFKADAKGGVSKVRVYVEGAVLDITTQSWVRYTDVNGLEKWFYGYNCEVDPANYIGIGSVSDATRGIRWFARAYPTDGTLHTQLLGVGSTYRLQNILYPATAPWGFKVQVDTLAGSDTRPNGAYPAAEAIVRDLQTALDYATGQLAVGGSVCATPGNAPLIEVVRNNSTFSVPPTSSASDYGYAGHGTPRGWCTVMGAAGVTSVVIGKTGPWDGGTTNGSPNNAWVVGYNGLVEFRGKAVTFDFTYFSGFGTYPTSAGPDRFWFWGNGCSSTCSWNMMTQLDDTGKNRIGWNTTVGLLGLKYVTDCPMPYVNALTGGGISRNNQYSNVCDDMYNSTAMAYGDRIVGFSCAALRLPQAAFTIKYTGGAGTATIGIDGPFGNAFNILLQINGVTSITIPVDGTTRIAALVASINGHAGWTAVSLVTPNDRVTDRAAWYITPSGGVSDGPWTSPGFTTTPYQVNTWIDQHMDLWQTGNGGGYTNVYMGSIQVFGANQTQPIFIDGLLQDSVMENVYVDQDVSVAAGQCAIGSMQHAIFRNYAVPAVPLIMGNAAGTSTWADSYCVFEGGVFKDFQWKIAGSGTAWPVLTDCHFRDGVAGGGGTYFDQGNQVASGISVGGTVLSIYPNAATNLDITPAGLLLSNLITAKSGYDALGAKAIGTVPKGPKFSPMPNGTLTKTQALELAAITSNDTVGSAVGTANLSWTNAGGGTDQLALTFNVA